jgi:hypothetical protein
MEEKIIDITSPQFEINFIINHLEWWCTINRLDWFEEANSWNIKEIMKTNIEVRNLYRRKVIENLKNK